MNEDQSCAICRMTSMTSLRCKDGCIRDAQAKFFRSIVSPQPIGLSDPQTLAERIAALEAENASALAYSTTLAKSMHRQHYADVAPNWQPLPDVVGVLTQIDNMYAGVRDDLATAEHENARLVGANLASLKAEVERLRVDAERYRWLTTDHDDADMRDSVKRIAESIRISGKGYIDAAIDAAMEKGK